MRGREAEREKPLEEYRRDIFALKDKLKTEEQQLLHLRQKYADADILADKSYSFSIKLKILECNALPTQTLSTTSAPNSTSSAPNPNTSTTRSTSPPSPCSRAARSWA